MKNLILLAGCALMSTATITAAPMMPTANVKTVQARTLEKMPLKDFAQKSFKKNDAKRMRAQAPKKESGEWTSIGTGSFNEAVLSSFFESITPTTVEAEFEQNVADPTTYRIVNPYANWDNPYSNLVYNENQDYYLVFHVINDQYVYIEDFNTGIEFEDESETLSPGDDYYIKVLSQAAGLIEGNGLETVINAVPGVMGRYENGIITFNTTFPLNNQNYYTHIIAWGNTSQGYYAVQQPFSIQMPDAEIIETEWTPYKGAKYTDDIIASLFEGLPPSTMEVNIEVDAADPNHYRILNPYADFSLEMDHNQDGEIEWHVYNDAYVYFTKINTGISYEGVALNAYLNAKGIVEMYGIDAVYEAFPEAFPIYSNGIITAPATFNAEGSQYPVFLVTFGVNNYAVNYNGAFRIEPEANQVDPYTWIALGMGRYTDDFLASYLNGVEITTFDVEVQQDADDENHYRLVNPYALWPVTAYSATLPGVAEFYIYQNAYAYFTKFETGVVAEGNTLNVVQNIMAALQNGLTLDTAIEIFPESLCKFEDGVLTATATFDNDGTPFSVFQIPIGDFFHRVNLQSAFRLELPNSIPDSVESIGATENSAPIYYNLQGMKVDNPQSGLYIRVNGNKTEKVML